MNWQMAGHTRVFALAATGLLLAAMGCNFAPPEQVQKGAAETASKTAVTSAISSTSGANPGINLQCAADRIQKASAPFHWSYKKVVPPMTNADWEADATPDSIAGTLIDSSGTRAVHGVRSDITGWNTAVLTLTGPLPASTFALVNNSSAIVRDGIENENGQDAIKYTIDTTQATGGETNLIKSVLGASGFIKGTAWVTPQGCPVKFVLNVEQHNNDGTVERQHHEANVTTP